ncbi:hypothetical protein BASA81_007507 [Batrachochytrium salamandrivorans]|nr:hypothetical protein BASA81_007507 [Batrachochytrium salamandrivorans]
MAKRARLQAAATVTENSDSEEDSAKPSAFKALLSSLSTSQYSSEEEDSQEEEEGSQEEDSQEEDSQGDNSQEDSQEQDSEEEEEDFEIPETLRRSLQASGEDNSEDDNDDDEEVEEEEGDALVETTHPFSHPVPTNLAKVHETFECETNNPDEPQTVYSLSGQVPLSPATSLTSFHLKSRLKLTWEQYQDAKSRGDSDLVDKLSPLISSYSDVMFESRDLFNAAELREMYVLHVCNHLFTYRDLVIRHDAKRGTGDVPVLRDQGFTRPRILVLLPYKSSCFRFIKLLIELFPNKTRVKNLDRFVEEFGPAGEEEGEEKEDKPAVDWRAFQRHCKSSESYTEFDFAERTHPGMTEAEAMGKPPKPADWHASFEENPDEDFRLGVSMLGPKSLKLYSGFYESDLIVASPLGLRLATKQAMETQGAGGDDGDDDHVDEEDEINEDEVLDIKQKKQLTRKQQKKAKDEEEDVDFLSSIEILIVDEADVFHTQNWQHLEDVCRGLNRRPKVLRKGMDLARVYTHLLPSKTKPQRQTLVFSAFPDAQLHALVARERKNASAVVVRPQTYVGTSLFCETGLVQRFRQVASGEARFDHFANNIIPKLLDNEQGQALLFVPDYLEFVRIRNAFKQQAAHRQRGLDKTKTKKQRTSLFECISEYSSASKVARSKSLFFHGKTRVLIVTERLQYYYRYRIRGIGRLVMYAPPQHAQFYTELCLLTQSEAVTFFTPLEALELERVLGTKRAKKALRGSETETVVVCE